MVMKERMKNKTNPPTKDYYNRPSKQTSFQIAAISFLCAIVMVLGIMVLKLIEKVSEDKNDFDYTSIHKKKEKMVDTLRKREFQLDGLFVRANVYFDEQACITSP